VIDGASHNLAVIDAQTHEVIANIPVGRRPWGIALTHDGKKAYVAHGVSNEVSVIAIDTRKIIASLAVGKMPWGITISR
jgi:YVTN family beta-propeller protein